MEERKQTRTTKKKLRNDQKQIYHMPEFTQVPANVMKDGEEEVNIVPVHCF